MSVLEKSISKMSIEEKIVQVNDMQQHYLECGSGPPLILLHGGLGTALTQWSNCLDSFGSAFKVYGLDTRGHGKSTNPDNLWSYTQFVNDLNVFIDKLEIEKPLICGWSDGAQTALEFAYTFPEKASGYVIGGAFYKMDDLYVRSLEKIGVTKESDSIDFEKLAKLKPEIVELLKGVHMGGDENYWKDLLTGEATVFRTEKNYSDDTLSKISEPVLIVLGDRDEFLPLDQAFNLYKRIDHSYLSIIPDTGHSLVIAHANKFCDQVLSFKEIVIQ